MAFEDIECVRPKTSAAVKVPVQGVGVSTRAAPHCKGSGSRYIVLRIGGGLAKGIALVQPEQKVRLLFGTGEDAGKVRVSPDMVSGRFTAKRAKDGSYALTINAASAEGLFALDFPPFVDAPIEALRPQNGQPPYFVFRASPAMLAVED